MWTVASSFGGRVAPVLRQQVVEQVVDGDGAEQPAVLVDDGRCDEVVGGEVPRTSSRLDVGPQRLDVGVEHVTDQRRRRLAQQPLDVRDAEQPAGRRLERRADDVDQCGERRGQLRRGGRGRGPRRRSRRAGGSPARWSSCRRRCAPRRTAAGGRPRPPRAPSAAAAPRRSPGAARRSGRRRRRATSPRGCRRHARCRARRGSRPGPPRAAPRGRRRAARRRARRRSHRGASAGRSWMTLARSAGRISSSAASRWVAPWPLLGRREALDLVPVDDVGLALAAEALRALLQGDLADHPVAGLGRAPSRRRTRCR